MTDKITLATVASFQNDSTAVAAVNNNSAIITAAINNTISRDGTSPNQMGAPLDMNSNNIANLPAPGTGSSPLRLQDYNTALSGGTISTSLGLLGDVTAPTNNINLTTTVAKIQGNPVTGSTGTGSLVFANNPTLTGTITINGTLIDPTGTSSPNIKIQGGTSGITSLVAQAIASGTVTVPSTTDTLVAKATTDTLTNKTFDTAGTGNVFKISGTTISANTGTGSNVLAVTPTLNTPTLTTPVINGTITGTTVIPIANGGTNDTGTSWTAYTPTITSNTGTFTTVSATGRYKTLGKTVFVEISITDTTNGTAAGFAIATLPFPPAAFVYGLFGLNTTAGFACVGNVVSAGGGTVNIFKYDGTFPLTTGQGLYVSGLYEST